MNYQAPVRDFQFLFNEWLRWPQQWQALNTGVELDESLQDAVLVEAARFCREVLAPLNRSGDEQGCTLKDGVVTTPDGFRAAWQQFAESGWQSLHGDPQFGGQGLPRALHIAVEEMIYSANTSFSLYSSLTTGATEALAAHADDAIKQRYLPKLISGQWCGAMCLTEPHCGTDLGLLKTKAVPADGGRYRITGTKIFITGGDHDLTENIIHLVLARLPDAPAGVRGISLFLVPKFLVNDDGSLAARNAIHCGSIEHKMGIKASATCVMNLDDAEGYLIGPAHEGLRCMFTMMNAERLSIAMQGIGLGEIAWQIAARYASDRKQGKAPGSKNAADPIIVHADVQRMLMTMRAYTEGGRALALWMGSLLDLQHHGSAEQQTEAEQIIAFLTPIAKAFFTDIGFDVCNHGVQTLGGHGYIREWGLEQTVRDARIAQIYEGTNGVQAMDLIGRKLLANQGKTQQALAQKILATANELHDSQWRDALKQALDVWQRCSDHLLQHASNSHFIGASAVGYLHLSGHVVYAWLWAQLAQHCAGKSDSFYQHKRQTADFYRLHLLPRIHSLAAQIDAEKAAWAAADASYFAV